MSGTLRVRVTGDLCRVGVCARDQGPLCVCMCEIGDLCSVYVREPVLCVCVRERVCVCVRDWGPVLCVYQETCVCVYVCQGSRTCTVCQETCVCVRDQGPVCMYVCIRGQEPVCVCETGDLYLCAREPCVYVRDRGPVCLCVSGIGNLCVCVCQGSGTCAVCVREPVCV